MAADTTDATDPTDATDATDADPAGVPSGLAAHLDFLVEIDALKGVIRRNWLADGSRRENTAEHSWQLGVAAALLAPYAAEAVDPATAITMALVHDIVEIDAGDTFAYDDHLAAQKAAAEERAAERLFGLLPHGAGDRLRTLWEQYEAGSTPEARFVMAIDRMMPTLLNLAEGATAWREAGITRDRVEARNRRSVEAGIPGAWPLLSERLDQAVADGTVEM